MRYRSHKRGKIAPASYPTINPTQTITGLVQDLVHERGRSVALAKIVFDDHVSYIPAINGLKVNQKISIGSKSTLTMEIFYN